MSSLQSFFLCVLKWQKVLIENLGNILHNWAKDEVQKILAKALNRLEKQEEDRYSHFFSEMIQEQYSSSPSRQLNKTKPSTKLVLISQGPLLYLEFNKPNIQNASEINLLKKKSIFPYLKITVDTLIDVRNEIYQNITS